MDVRVTPIVPLLIIHKDCKNKRPPFCTWKIPKSEILGLRMGRNGQMKRSISIGPVQEKNGVLVIMPNRPVTDQWKYQRKMKRHFLIKKGQFPDKGKEPVCQNLGRNIPIEISGPPPDVIPNIPIRRNRNGLFEFYSKMLKSLANGKHPWPTSKSERIFSKLLPLDGTDLFRSSRPKFPEILVKWMAPI